MDIKRPRRILLLGAPDTGVLELLTSLCGSSPAPVDNSTAGLSHIWAIKTNYYTADLPIWIDEISSLDEWTTEFSKTEAREVITSLGAWIYCFRRPVTQEDFESVKATIKAIQTVIEKAAGYGWDGTCLAVVTPQSITPYLDKPYDEWDDVCREFGFEYIDSEAKGRNEFGEPAGVERLQEAIEATDWNGDDDLDFGDFDDPDEEIDFSSTFAAEEAEMGSELLGLKSSIAHGGDGGQLEDEELQVEGLEKMMSQLQAIKDTSSAMPEAERKRFANTAVNELLKSL
ncbi:hypothetical protein BT63DRAFT_329909 [Microthyrium microscopicum]|uniref:Increased recombination centers protein 6 n=1 Tax=Microthyrium microscopicum TaxID=703497 RepID=A0A6A6U5C8_9PEZI|nr:hypothetical protein BT63DRAFT_329909 [Microthyrium microscopicum]